MQTWTHVRSIPIVIFEFMGFVQIIFLPILAFSITTKSIPILQITGLIISLNGLFLASWAKYVMGKSWGRPAQHDKQTQSKLITTGPFTFSRNPIYVGLFLLFTGQQIALASYGIFVAIAFAYTIYQAVQTEERLLERHFGAPYTEYKKRVPRFL